MGSVQWAVPSDPELIDAHHQGDPSAGAALVDRYYGSILRFFRNKLPTETHDLTQQTFAECFASLHRLKDTSRFRSFLFAIACHQLRKRYRARAADGARLDFGTVSAVDLDPSPSAVIARRQEHIQLLTALRSIPIDAQLVLELHYWEDMRLEEIAEVLGLPVGTAKSRLTRARRALGQAMEGARGAGEAALTRVDGWARELREETGLAQ